MAREDTRSDEALLMAAMADPEALAVFYRRHLRSVLAFLLNRTRRPELAADLAAETFAAVLEGLPRFRPQEGRARAWLFSIAAHKLADSARRGRVADSSRHALGMPARALEDAELEPSEELLDAARLAEDLDALLADLPSRQRDALLARVVDERPYPEIAEQWECSEAVVRQRVSRGLATMRRRLGEAPK